MFNFFYLKRVFPYFDEFIADLKMWNIEICQLQPGRFENSFSQCFADGMLLSVGCFNGLTHQTGASPPGRTFAFLIDDNSHINWRGLPVSKNHLMLFPQDGAFDVVTKAQHTNVVTVTIPEELLTSKLAEIEHEHFLQNISAHEVFELASCHFEPLRKTCVYYLEILSKNPELISSGIFRDELRTNVIEQVIMAIRKSNDANECHSSVQSNIIWDKIETHVEERYKDPVQVADLCRVANVSRSTLQRYFLKRFSVSPKTYLNMIRLNGVRQDLKQHSYGEIEIASAANKWGFWHMGQFAADYRRLFRELPSETLLS